MSSKSTDARITNYRWAITGLLFFSVAINYMDRQVLSLTWKDFIAPEFHWTNNDYGTITGLFSIFYAVCLLFAGRFVDWIDTKEGIPLGHWCLVSRCRLTCFLRYSYLRHHSREMVCRL